MHTELEQSHKANHSEALTEELEHLVTSLVNRWHKWALRHEPDTTFEDSLETLSESDNEEFKLWLRDDYSYREIEAVECWLESNSLKQLF